MTALHFAAAKLAQVQPLPVLNPRFDQFFTRTGGAQLLRGEGWIKPETGPSLPVAALSFLDHQRGAVLWAMWGNN